MFSLPSTKLEPYQEIRITACPKCNSGDWNVTYLPSGTYGRGKIKYNEQLDWECNACGYHVYTEPKS